MPNERGRGEEQRDGGRDVGMRKGYFCWLLRSKHKQKQNPPCCHSGPPADLSVTADMSALSTPQACDTHGLTNNLDPPLELQRHKRQCDAVRNRTQERHLFSVSLSYSLNTDIDITHTLPEAIWIPQGLFLLQRGLCLPCSTARKYIFTSPGGK